MVEQGIMNHEELTKELAKAFYRVADVLPQSERLSASSSQ